MNDWITKIQGQRTKTLAAAFLATSIASPVAAEDSTSPEASSQIIAAETELKKTTDSLGIKLWGYMRGGFYGALHGAPKAQYQLGGDLQHYRLGNEGDTYLEFGIGKQWDVGNGLKWGTYYMPTVYNGTTGTAQLFTDISGLEFAPAVSLWAGQRYHRIADIHIVDHWLMEDGDNFGAGADGIPLASGQISLAVYSGGSMNNHDTDPNNAKRANFQLRNLAVNPGGKLTLTGGVVRGQFREGSGGGALGLMHQQSDFIVAGLDNFFFLQGSRGHSALSGKFHGLDTEGTPHPGARQVRIADAINWQVGRFGGQALVGWQSLSPDDASPGHRDFSMGGRVTYGMGRHTKLEAELGLNQRSVRGQAHQQLGKATLAVAFAPDTDFWTRPELRLYVTHARWNDAARIANADSFGADGRRQATTFGVQVEAWWE